MINKSRNKLYKFGIKYLYYSVKLTTKESLLLVPNLTLSNFQEPKYLKNFFFILQKNDEEK